MSSPARRRLPKTQLAVIDEEKMKYILEGPLSAPDGRRPRVRTIWFAANGETTLRLVTAYAARGAER